MFTDSLDLTLSTNSSVNKFVYDTYALQMQDIDPDTFKGQTFTVNLGSVEEALNSTEGFKDESLKISEMDLEVLDNSTAAVQISEKFIEECQMENTSSSNLTQRLSYNVFITDILFQSLKVNSTLAIGSIIVSTRLRCKMNSSLSNPIRVIFFINDKVRINNIILK